MSRFKCVFCAALLLGGFLSSGCESIVYAKDSQQTTSSNEEGIEQSKKLVSNLCHDALEIISTKNITVEEAEKRFKPLLENNFALSSICKYIFGVQFKNLTEEQKKKCLKGFSRVLIKAYVKTFLAYKASKIDINVVRVKLGARKDRYIVMSVIKIPGKEDIRLNWSVYYIDKRYLVFDVIVDGVSLSKIQKTLMAERLKANGSKNKQNALDRVVDEIDSGNFKLSENNES